MSPRWRQGLGLRGRPGRPCVSQHLQRGFQVRLLPPAGLSVCSFLLAAGLHLPGDSPRLPCWRLWVGWAEGRLQREVGRRRGEGLGHFFSAPSLFWFHVTAVFPARPLAQALGTAFLPYSCSLGVALGLLPSQALEAASSRVEIFHCHLLPRKPHVQKTRGGEFHFLRRPA